LLIALLYVWKYEQNLISVEIQELGEKLNVSWRSKKPKTLFLARICSLFCIFHGLFGSVHFFLRCDHHHFFSDKCELIKFTKNAARHAPQTVKEKAD
jgi:hypothetical protein